MPVGSGPPEAYAAAAVVKNEFASLGFLPRPSRAVNTASPNDVLTGERVSGGIVVSAALTNVTFVPATEWTVSGTSASGNTLAPIVGVP